MASKPQLTLFTLNVIADLQTALERWHRLAKESIVCAVALYPSPEGQRVELIFPIPESRSVE